jgi:MFS family permease
MASSAAAPVDSEQPSALRPLVAAFSIQAFGWGVLLLVFSYGSYSAANSAFDVAAIGACIAAPSLILMPLSARIVHRFPPRQLNVVVLLIDFVLYVALAVYTATFGESLALLFVAAGLTGALFVAITVPAWRNLIRVAVPAEQISQLNSRLISGKSIGQVVGVLASGVLYQFVGDAGLFLITAFCILPLAWAIARMPITGAGSIPEPSARSSLGAALREIWLSNLMRSVFVLMAAMIFAAWPLMTLLPSLADQIFPSSRVAVSFLTAMFFSGSAIVAFAVRWRIDALEGTNTHALVSGKRHPWTRSLLMLAGLAIALLALTAQLEPALLGLVVTGLLLAPTGLLLGLLGVMTQSLVQREISASSAAMALTAYVIVVEIGTSAGSLVAAALADSVGVFTVLVGLGVLGVLVTFWLVRARRYESVSALAVEAFVPGELIVQLSPQPERRN